MRLQGVDLLMEVGQFFLQTNVLLFFLLDKKFELADPALEVIYLRFELALLLLEIFLHLKNLDVDGLVLLDLRNQLFLGQGQVFVDLFQLILDLLDLLATSASKETTP